MQAPYIGKFLHSLCPAGSDLDELMQRSDERDAEFARQDEDVRKAFQLRSGLQASEEK